MKTGDKVNTLGSDDMLERNVYPGTPGIITRCYCEVGCDDGPKIYIVDLKTRIICCDENDIALSEEDAPKATSTVNPCVMCGAETPEGRIICGACENK